METWQIVAILWVVLFAPLGDYVAIEKRRPRLKGVFMGALFGPIGCLIEACLPCGEKIATVESKPKRRSIEEQLSSPADR